MVEATPDRYILLIFMVNQFMIVTEKPNIVSIQLFYLLNMCQFMMANHRFVIHAFINIRDIIFKYKYLVCEDDTMG